MASDARPYEALEEVLLRGTTVPDLSRRRQARLRLELIRRIAQAIEADTIAREEARVRERASRSIA